MLKKRVFNEAGTYIFLVRDGIGTNFDIRYYIYFFD